MRFTQILNRQHLDFMFKKHWRIQGKRTPRDTGAEAILRARGIEIVEGASFTRPNLSYTGPKFDIVGYKLPPIALDNSHPDWHDESAHVFCDDNVLLDGVRQAQVLTNTFHIHKLPDKLIVELANTKIPQLIDASMEKAVLSSHILDAEQEKLSIIKDPLRPAFNFPRIYGISNSRKSQLIISKLLLHCERLAGRNINISRRIVRDASFDVPIYKDLDFIQFELCAETLISSQKPLQTFETATEQLKDLPVLHPLKSTIAIPKANIYKKSHQYPISQTSTHPHPHTILLHFSKESIKHLHETPLTDTQVESRSLLKSFTVASAKAHQMYGPDVKHLETPITVQCVQTDGRSFFFGVFELNTLNLNENSVDGVRNKWFSIPKVDIFGECSYQSARPQLSGYNSDVLKLMKTFYCNN